MLSAISFQQLTKPVPFFKTHPNAVHVLDTRWTVDPPPDSGLSTIVLDCYTDTSGDLIFCAARDKTAEWTNRSAEPIETKLAKQISEQYDVRGGWSLNLRQEKTGTPVVVAGITPHLTPELALQRSLGANFILLMLHETRGNQVSVLPNRACACMPCNAPNNVTLAIDFKTVFLDLDDTLIIHGILNELIMNFVHACKRRNIEVYLITRHHQQPEITLRAFNIDPAFFMDIIWITDRRPKSSFMQDTAEPIFIDDAFSERCEVSSNTNVPCFSPDMVEALARVLE